MLIYKPITRPIFVLSSVGQSVSGYQRIKTVRDMVDIYYLSKNEMPLHKFIRSLDRVYQRGMIQWYRSYSRQEVKLGIFDLDIYDKKFDVCKMISHLDSEIKKYMSEVLE